MCHISRWRRRGAVAPVMDLQGSRLSRPPSEKKKKKMEQSRDRQALSVEAESSFFSFCHCALSLKDFFSLFFLYLMDFFSLDQCKEECSSTSCVSQRSECYTQDGY